VRKKPRGKRAAVLLCSPLGIRASSHAVISPNPSARPYNVHMKLWPFIAVGAGVIIGVLLTIGVSSIWISLAHRQQVIDGFVMGFGIGFGGIAALLTLNRLIGYLDKLASGKAEQP
jgi:hypothetical protein